MPASLALLPEAAVALDRRGADPRGEPADGGDVPARSRRVGDRRARRVSRAVLGGDRGCGVRHARAGRAAGGPARRRRAVRARRQRSRARRRPAVRAARGRPPASEHARRGVRPDAARDGAVQHRRRVRARERGAVRAARPVRGRADRHARPGTHAPRRPPERHRRRLAHPQRRAQHLAVREALRAPGRRGRVDAGQPDVPARRVRPPAVLGRPVPGHHRAAPDGLSRPADRCAQPARVRHRTRAQRGLRAPGRAARARPRRLQGDQRRPRPSRGRRVAARDRGRDRAPAAPRRRAGAARRRRVRGAALRLRDGPRRAGGGRHRRAGRRSALRLRRRRALA